MLNFRLLLQTKLDKDLGLAIYSSRGYTSDGRVKPDVATIGSNIMAPDAASSDGYTSKSGTSMATPLMAGIPTTLMVEANRTSLLQNSKIVFQLILSRKICNC